MTIYANTKNYYFRLGADSPGIAGRVIEAHGGKPKEIYQGTFWSEQDKKLYMVRCPKCHLENYALNVSSGICTWCGYDVNKRGV